MTSMLLVLYLAGAVCEVASVALVVRQFQRARRRWFAYSEALAQERRLMEADLRYRLDPLTTRYGITPGEIQRASSGVEALLATDVREQATTVVLLIAGIILGTAGNILGL